MTLEILAVAGTFVLAVGPFNITLVALNIVEDVFMLMKKLGGILLKELHEFIEFRLTLQYGCLYRNLPVSL